jgi:hypothetical protein
MAKGEGLEETSNEASHGNSEKSRLSAPSVSELTANKGASDCTGLHGCDEVAGEISSGRSRRRIETVFTAFFVSIKNVFQGEDGTVYRLKSGITRTPPMIPASTPKRAPAKHA